MKHRSKDDLARGASCQITAFATAEVHPHIVGGASQIRRFKDQGRRFAAQLEHHRLDVLSGEASDNGTDSSGPGKVDKLRVRRGAV
jgi:hypothetical protein